MPRELRGPFDVVLDTNAMDATIMVSATEDLPPMSVEAWEARQHLCMLRQVDGILDSMESRAVMRCVTKRIAK